MVRLQITIHTELLSQSLVVHFVNLLVSVHFSGAKNINETTRSHFEFSILKALLSLLNTITEVRSPGGLQWIFSLLLKVTSKNSHYVAAKCVTLLNKMSEELENRTNPYHLLLRSRYGLYGTPLELELFDIEPPPYTKSSSTYVTYASAVSGDNLQSTDFFENYSFNKESINPKDVLSGTETKLKWRNLAPPKIYRGLIETEPLHFTCISASEGTRLERADATSTIVVSNEMPTIVAPFHGQTSLDKMDPMKIKYLVDYGDEPTATVVKEFKNSNPQASTSGIGTWDSDDCQVFIGGLPVDVGNHLLKKLGELDKKKLKYYKQLCNNLS